MLILASSSGVMTSQTSHLMTSLITTSLESHAMTSSKQPRLSMASTRAAVVTSTTESTTHEVMTSTEVLVTSHAGGIAVGVAVAFGLIIIALILFLPNSKFTFLFALCRFQCEIYLIKFCILWNHISIIKVLKLTVSCIFLILCNNNTITECRPIFNFPSFQANYYKKDWQSF